MRVADLNTRAASNNAQTLSLKDPFSKTGELLRDEDGSTVDIYIYGMSSDASRNALKERERRYGKKEELSDDEAADFGAEYLASITAGWSDNLEDDDGPITFSHANAKRLYQEQDWIALQVSQFAMDLSNYDPKKSLSKSGTGSGTSRGRKRGHPRKKSQDTKD